MKRKLVSNAVDVDIGDLRCPYCNYQKDKATQLRYQDQDAELPSDGDLSICMNCAEVCAFDSSSKGGMRKLNEVEGMLYLHDERVIAGIQAVRRAKKEKGWG